MYIIWKGCEHLMIESRLPEFIYQGKSIPDILSLYEAELRKGEDFESIAHATALRSYNNLISDRQFLRIVRRTFENLYRVLDETMPDLHYCIDGRRKSLISTERKLCRLLNNKKSLDLFRDAFAYRILVFGDDTNSSPELVSSLYQTANAIIQFFVDKGLILCEADPLSDTMAEEAPERSQLIIPKKSEISSSYLYGVKDYVFSPKANGYQSLHITFRSPSRGYCFEIQLRTFGMHLEAVDGTAEHGKYKDKKYQKIEFDRTQVHIPGYGISNGKVYDFIGLEEPLVLTHRVKTF